MFGGSGLERPKSKSWKNLSSGSVMIVQVGRYQPCQQVSEISEPKEEITENSGSRSNLRVCLQNGGSDAKCVRSKLRSTAASRCWTTTAGRKEIHMFLPEMNREALTFIKHLKSIILSKSVKICKWCHPLLCFMINGGWLLAPSNSNSHIVWKGGTVIK